MMQNDELNSIGKYALKARDLLKKKALDQAEVIVFESRDIHIKIEKNRIFSSNLRSTRSISIRAFLKGGMGRYSTTVGRDKDIEEAVERVSLITRSVQSDPDFRSLPYPSEMRKIENLFDPEIASIEKDKIFSWATCAIEEALNRDPNIMLSGSVASSSAGYFLANTNGVEAGEKSTHISMHLFGVIRRKGETGSGFDFDEAVMLKDFSPGGLGGRVANKAIKQLGARRINGGRLPVIFGPLASEVVLGFLAGACNAEDVQRRRSFLCGMKGKKIASEVLTLFDDPLIPAGLNSSAFDGEGTPHKKITILEKGVLKTYLHNSYTSHKSGEENTAHATFGGGISPTNLIPELGKRTEEEIIKEVKEGIYIDSTSFSPDPVSGDFSQVIDFGFKIENGRLSFPLKDVMIGGNFLQLLRDIEEVSSDYREEPGSIMPTLKVREISVSGD